MINYIIPIKVKEKAKSIDAKRKVLDSVKHAWQTSLSWRAKKGKIEAGWVCNTRPGYVNCLDPRVPAAEAEMLSSGKEGFVKPQYKGNGALLAGTEIGLLDAPAIPIHSWRDISSPITDPNTGEQSFEPIPPFFFTEGVNPEQSGLTNLNADNFDNFKINIDAIIQNQARLLFKADLFLVQPRPSYSIQVSIPGNFVTGQIVDYSVNYNTTTLSALGSRARLQSMDLMPTPHAATFDEQAGGGFGDDGVDYLKIAKLFWLSPPTNGTGDGTDPKDPLDVDNDGNPTWTPYVQHLVFYNLSYQSKNPTPLNIQQVGLDPFLSFFLGQYSFAPAASYGLTESVQQQVFQAILNSSDNSGQFWST